MAVPRQPTHFRYLPPPSVHPAAKLKTMNRLKLSFDFIYIPPYIYFYKLLFSYIFYVTIIYLIADFLKPIYLVLFSHYLLLYIIICNNILIKYYKKVCKKEHFMKSLVRRFHKMLYFLNMVLPKAVLICRL